MIEKLQTAWTFVSTHKTVIFVFSVLFILLIVSFYFRTAPLIINHDPITPVQPDPPKVNYTIDKNRLGCILNHAPADIQKMCETAFPYGK